MKRLRAIIGIIVIIVMIVILTWAAGGFNTYPVRDITTTCSATQQAVVGHTANGTITYTECAEYSESYSNSNCVMIGLPSTTCANMTTTSTTCPTGEQATLSSGYVECVSG